MSQLMLNKSFGKWTVIEDNGGFKRRKVTCKCVCERVFEVSLPNLLLGKSKGCIYCREHAKLHGLADKHRLYSTWKSMLSRCNNKNTKNYKSYGALGIKVCDEWRDFTKFLEDMWESFEEGKTLDRIDFTKGYYKDNCRWATSKEQSLNTRRNLKIPYNGYFVTESQLADITGVPRSTIQARRNRGANTHQMIYGFK